MQSAAMNFALGLASLAFGGEALAQYNLRVIPSTPQAGAPFVVAFDGNECEVFLISPPGAPPAVTVQGSTVRLDVDRVTVANCAAQPVMHTLNVPALAEGSYQLELVARAFGSPGNNSLAEAIAFGVGPASTFSPVTIPATDPWALAAMSLMLLLGVMYVRQRRS